MSVNTVLFDLDGTLLPMDQEVFTRAYFGALCKKIAPLGYTPDNIIKCVWAGTGAMIKNDGKATNEEVFWNAFTAVIGEKILEDKSQFDDFYLKEFESVKDSCGFNEKSAEVIALLKEKGINAVLATNPIFPDTAVKARIRWAGLSADDFIHFTSYENSRYCKPNPDYYREILSKIGKKPEECLMVGNDVGDDMTAQKIGMKVFLLTDCLINKENEDIEKYPHGSFDELIKFIKEL